MLMSVLNWFPVMPRSSSKPLSLAALSSGRLSYSTPSDFKGHVRCITAVHLCKEFSTWQKQLGEPTYMVYNVKHNQKSDSKVQFTEKPRLHDPSVVLIHVW